MIPTFNLFRRTSQEDVQTVSDNLNLFDEDNGASTSSDPVNAPELSRKRMGEDSSMELDVDRNRPIEGEIASSSDEDNGASTSFDPVNTRELGEDASMELDVDRNTPIPSNIASSSDKDNGASTSSDPMNIREPSRKRTGDPVELDVDRNTPIPGKIASSSDKFRHKEVDYSLSLRHELYQKEALVNKLQEGLREQGRQFQERHIALQKQYEDMHQRVIAEQNHAVTNLESLLRQRDNELTALRKILEIQSGQQESARQHNSQVEELRKQFELHLQSQIGHLKTNRAAEIETCVREEVTRLSATFQAEKERELANIEQRYARFKKSAEMNVDPREESPQTPLRRPQRTARPTPPSATPTLDAIKNIRRKRHGTSTRTRLMGVCLEDDDSDSQQAQHAEEIGAHAEPDPPLPVSAVVDAVAKNVGETLRTFFGSNGQFSPNAGLRRRPPKRKMRESYEVQLERASEPPSHRDFILGEVRRLFKEKLGITRDIDFITHKPADPTDIHAYEYEDGPEPDTDVPAFDLTQNYSSPWNSFILNNFLQELQMRCDEELWPVQKKDDYIEELLRERYKRLRTVWRNAQPKLTARGVLETPTEVEARLIEDAQRSGKQSRQDTRRRNKYGRRETILSHIVKIKSEVGEDDLPNWKWLQRLIKALGEEGMSSEESSVENGITNVLRVKNLEWRRNIEKELEIIDLQRVLDKDIFHPQGSIPIPRKRAFDNPKSTRDPVRGLPTALYDDVWISQLTSRQKESLGISNERFPWMKVIVA